MYQSYPGEKEDGKCKTICDIFEILGFLMKMVLRLKN